ncbi:hypothetical protein WQE_15769 [Paraburkholderia hospita]|uniref:Uncharacterized protein n=1 Tax=Paraburkholderia hospita TaxID=169430 RepID=A0ABN0FN24_9BURK|nr:hypothetical protein WQE_15769 [Paraburkholderia hospita]
MAAFWMPLTANGQFKSAPRLLSGATGMCSRRTMAGAFSTGSRGCGA